jgi:hypothetical protein
MKKMRKMRKMRKIKNIEKKSVTAFEFIRSRDSLGIVQGGLTQWGMI